jgi:hypothetical protein
MHYGAVAPIQWYSIPATERDQRCQLSSDQCVIDNRQFFIVGNLEITVHGMDERFSWDVWVSLNEKDFLRACELWEQPGRESEPPCFGCVYTALPGYPDTVGLNGMVHTRKIGRRPRVVLDPTDHPLAVEQRQGIAPERVQEIAELVLHGQRQN